MSQPPINTVQPQPSPFTSVLGYTRLSDGSTRVVLQIHTVHGPLHFFPTPEEAEMLAEAIRDAARQARTGLVRADAADARAAAEQWQAATNAIIRGQG